MEVLTLIKRQCLVLCKCFFTDLSLGGGCVGGSSYILLHYQPVFSHETINLDCATSAKPLWMGFVYRIAESKSDH